MIGGLFAIPKEAITCAICRRSDIELVVDHDHQVKAFRGVLCRACNLMIGYAHEDIATLFSAVYYLERWRARVLTV